MSKNLSSLFILFLGAFLSLNVAEILAEETAKTPDDGRFSPPPNAVVSSECADDGAVRICSINKNSTFPRLVVRYEGYLMHEAGGDISVWVQLNSRSGQFKLRNLYRYHYLEINDVRNLSCCWTFDPPASEDKALFLDAFEADGTPKTWNVQVAFFMEKEQKWDSKYGQNYRVKL